MPAVCICSIIGINQKNVSALQRVMKYKNTISGKFIDRPNRFVAHAAVNGNIETVHIKNTGRCKELLLPGADVTLALSNNPKRKTKYDLISVYKSGIGWINIDSQVPNTVVKEWLETGPQQFPDIQLLKPECIYGNSRVDFYLECSGRRAFIEVKGCTLEIAGIGYFPDAPTERGVKHLHELAKAVGEGYECFIAFVIAIPGVTNVLPNRAMHPEFGAALDAAVKAGVKILYLPCNVTPGEIAICL
jgi:sugar fermentation stimulation protein A